MKKFNGHRCERRNLTDLLLDGAGPDGTKRKQPKAKKRPKNFTTEPAANKRFYGGPATPVNALLGILDRHSMPGASRDGNMDVGTQALMEYTNAAQGRVLEPMTDEQKAETNYSLNKEKLRLGLPQFAQGLYDFEQRSAEDRGFVLGGLTAPGLDYNMPQAPLSLDQLYAQANMGQGAPGQVPGKLAELLGDDAKASAISAGGQAVGEFVTGLDKRASDPGAKYGLGEGAGALIKGATNPLAMSLGPVGMAAGAALGLGASLFKHKKEKDEFELAQEEAREERIANEMAAAQSFSDQVLQTYSQEGVGGGLYHRHGGPVDRFYTGGPTEPPAVMPGMEQYAQYANLNPELAAAVANMPERNDRLTSYTDSQLSINEQNAALRQEDESFQPVRDAFNDPGVMMDTAQLGLGVLQTSELPVISQVAGAANALGYGARGIYSGMKGDLPHAGMYAGLSGLSVAGMIPAAGASADAAVVAKQLQALNSTRPGTAPIALTLANEAAGVSRGAQALKTAHTAEHIAHPIATFDKGVNVGTGGNFKPSYAMNEFEQGGPVDYETEKSEVILASPNDPPVAVGQGKYKQVSNNLYRAKGPSHKHGGIPTRGATEPFVDNTGTYNDSPYVFSDAKEMRFDPSEILSMIT